MICRLSRSPAGKPETIAHILSAALIARSRSGHYMAIGYAKANSPMSLA
jgi:hypothetical protein